MNQAEWILVGTTLFLGITALLAPVVSEAIKRKFFSPIVTVKFDETSPYCHKTFYRIQEVPEYVEPAFFFRFKVENTGKSKLTQCEAVLEQLWIYNSAGIPKKLSGFNDVTLKWAGNKPECVDLSPNRGKYCIVGHITSLKRQNETESKIRIDLPGQHVDKPRFMFELMEYPYSQPNCLLPGKYAIKISLYSENAPTQELWFEIAWSGNWQETENEIFRELTMRKIRKIQNS